MRQILENKNLTPTKFQTLQMVPFARFEIKENSNE
jgi:hypothetical protein